jgi:alkylation response protein AidB-like acyl-CoA dehydrogenase
MAAMGDSSAGSGGTAGRDAPLERARRLAPVIAGAAAEGERARRLAEPVVAALLDAGLYRLLLPRALDGAELEPAAFVRVIEEVGRADASAAWCLCQAAGCTMIAGYVTPEVAPAIFGDRRAILAWGPSPDARAVPVDGGYRVTGTFHFGSGCRQATWLGGQCAIKGPDGAARRRPDGAPETRWMLFPAERATILDTWHVIGLRGTGSDAFRVEDLFVPRERSAVRDDPAERRHAGPLYCFPTTSLYASGFAGVALGNARSALDALVALARAKTPRGLRQPLRESPVVQAELARTEARVGAARAFLLSLLEEVWEDVTRTGTLGLDQRVRIRMAATHAITEATAAVDWAYHAAGATAIFEGNAFERRFRDAHTVAQQVQGRQSHFETVGRVLLGLEPDTTAFI